MILIAQNEDWNESYSEQFQYKQILQKLKQNSNTNNKNGTSTKTIKITDIKNKSYNICKNKRYI